MTGARVVGVLLILLGLVCALMYVGWLPRPAKSGSAADLPAGTAATEPVASEPVAIEPVASQVVGPQATPPPGSPRALTLAWVQGTYISTTMAISRQERVAAEGLDGRARATMVVDDGSVRWEREGLGEMRVPGPWLLGASTRRGLANQLLGRAHIVLVSWRADNGTNGTNGTKDRDGDLYVTAFLPRTRADSGALVTAVQRLMRIGASVDGAPTTPDGTT